MKSPKHSKAMKFSLTMLEFVALISACIGANTACAFLYHDPKKPETLKSLKKI